MEAGDAGRRMRSARSEQDAARASVFQMGATPGIELMAGGPVGSHDGYRMAG